MGSNINGSFSCIALWVIPLKLDANQPLRPYSKKRQASTVQGVQTDGQHIPVHDAKQDGLIRDHS